MKQSTSTLEHTALPGVKSEFAARLREAIKRAGYASITEFCLEKKYSTAQFYIWIGGRRIPRPLIVQRLARDLNVQPGWLLFGENL